MSLAMSRPWKHPVSGFYYYRRRVPDDLRKLVGRSEEKFSLQTKDPREAKQRHAQRHAEVTTRWENLRRGKKTFSERQAHELASVLGARFLERFHETPSEHGWPTKLADRMWATPRFWVETDKDGTLEWKFALSEDERSIFNMEAFCRDEAARELRDQGLIVDQAEGEYFARAIGYAMQRAALQLDEFAKGIYNGGSATAADQIDTQVKVSPISLAELFEGWKRERKPSPKTANEWRGNLDSFCAFVGHDDAARVSTEDVIRWKDSLLSDGLSAKTIQSGKLASLKAFFEWGVDNQRIRINPAERVRLGVKVAAGKQKRGFNEDEANQILKAALAEENSVLRWTPWLGAFSGARLGELCQLRREDIVKIDGVWCMKIDPAAGPLKTLSSERAVPLHQSLIKIGFLRYVETVPSGPLFPELPLGKYNKRGAMGAKLVGRWVRSLGLSDERLSPSHSWRHRFKTLGRRHALNSEMLEAIMGHGRKTVAASYGEFPMDALHREISKIPGHG